MSDAWLNQSLPEFFEKNFPPRIACGMRKFWREDGVPVNSLDWPTMDAVLKHENPRRQLLKYRGFGLKALRALEAKLKDMGVALPPDQCDTQQARDKKAEAKRRRLRKTSTTMKLALSHAKLYESLCRLRLLIITSAPKLIRRSEYQNSHAALKEAEDLMNGLLKQPTTTEAHGPAAGVGQAAATEQSTTIPATKE